MTECLKMCGIGVYPANVPLALIERAGAIGTAVHTACQFLDEGDLDNDTLDQTILPYVVAYQRWREQYAPEWEGIELQIESQELRLAGTIDRVGMIQGERYIVDIKSQKAKAKHWGLQIAGYYLLDGKQAKRGILWVANDGSFKWLKYDDEREVAVFRSILEVSHWILGR